MSNALADFSISAAVPIALDGDETKHFAITTAAANLFTGTAPLDWLGWPGMQDLGTHWICGYQQREGHQVAGDGSGSRMHFSDDDGATWTAAGKFLDGEDVTGLPAGVGSCYFLVAPNGDVLFFAGTYVDTVYRSSDGGKTWASAASGITDPDLRMQAGYGFTLDGVIYVPMHKFTSQPGNTTPWDQEVWTSDDDGATWELRGTVPYAPGASGDEFSIINTGGTNLVAICRDFAAATTYYNTSSDLGATWSARQEIDGMGIMQMMRMRRYAGGIIGFGREGKKTQGSVYTTVWYSLDAPTWCRKFRPDTQGFGDAAYCDVLERVDGKFYLMTYGGTDAVASIRSGVFEIV